MTGYGAGDAPIEGGGRVLVEIRAVNHRYLDVRLRLPTELAAHAQSVENLIRGHTLRGRLEATVRLEGLEHETIELDVQRARKAFAELAALRDELQPGEPLPLTLLTTVPDLYRRQTTIAADAARDALDHACEQACGALVAMRQREGLALAQEIVRLLDEIATLVTSIQADQTRVVNAYRKRLRARLQDAIAATKGELERPRLEQEIALQVERCDVTEELARLWSHIEQARALIAAEADTKGRKLDFIAQELARESNTLGAKTNDSDVIARVIDLKTAVERIREQVQNVL